MFAVFEATKVFLQNVIVKGKVEEIDRLDFLRGTQGSRFIFGAKMSKYLDDIHAKATWVNVLNQGGSDKAREQRDAILWLDDQLKGIETRFEPHF